MSDRQEALDKIIAGKGTALLNLSQWLDLNDHGDARLREIFVETEAKRMDMTSAELLAAADRTTVAVEAKIIRPTRPHEFYIKAYAYEIQDAPAPAP